MEIQGEIVIQTTIGLAIPWKCLIL